MRFEQFVTDEPATAALALVRAAITSAVLERGRALLALGGGSSPLPLFRLLAATDLPWERVWVTFGDERFVALDHEHSNAGSAMKHLLNHVAVPPSQVLTWPILTDPAESAQEYRRQLERAFGGFPTFDLNLLGLGADGHTASLFPGTGAALLAGPTLAVRAPEYASPGGWRLSMSASALSDSREVLFLVTGAGKGEALRQTFGAEARSAERSDAALDAHPARAIAARDRLTLVT
ncbi:MAG: 6-phosphogluconolactonase, partial [Trueperaceae bacterium]